MFQFFGRLQDLLASNARCNRRLVSLFARTEGVRPFAGVVVDNEPMFDQPESCLLRPKPPETLKKTLKFCPNPVHC